MTFFLFPGQGAQKPGMGRDFLERSPAARDVFEEAAAAMPPGFLDTVFDGPAEDLDRTAMAQPALLTVEVAIARALEARGVRPDGVAGHSLGEISALTAAGALTLADALRLVRERARVMSEDVPEGGMAAVLGLGADAIEPCLPDSVQVANYNGPAQTVITGARDGLDRAAEALKRAGAKRIVPLRVSGPFHSRLMEPGARQLRGLLADIQFEAPRVTFVSSVSGVPEADPESIRRLLGEQLCSPVRWTDVMRWLGSRRCIEAGPGTTLQGLAKRMDGGPEVAPAGTFEAAEQLPGDGSG